MEKVLKIQSLSKNFGSINAVRELSLDIPKGSVFGILGPNGSGKTTTLGMVLGVTRPSSGTFKWFDESLSFRTKKRIGALLETPNFYPYLSAEKNLKIVATIKDLKNPKIDEILETVNLHDRSKSNFKTYSLGMKQRLAIASALLSEPEVLVLDEPTNGLDPEGIAEIRSIIRNIAEKGITIILASHLLDEVEKVCSHVAVLRYGDLLFNGTVNEMTGMDGVVEISAEDNEKLKTTLQEFTDVDGITEENGKLILTLKGGANATTINQYLAQKGIYANHLVFRKNSLEEQFLELVKNPTA